MSRLAGHALLCKNSLSLVLNSTSPKQDGGGTRYFITYQLFLIKVKFVKKTLLKKIGVFAFRNSPITRNGRNRNVDLTKLLHGSACAPLCQLALCDNSGFSCFTKKTVARVH